MFIFAYGRIVLYIFLNCILCLGKEEPDWVEVMVEILLSFLSQPNRLMRQVSKMVFTRICPHVTKEALQLILDVSNVQ